MRDKVALGVFIALVAALLPLRAVWAADPATEEARQHYLKGNQLFELGRWDDAAEEYEKGYVIKNDPSFLYNMAQAFRRKGDTKRAIDLYKNYLIKAPGSPQRADVEERIRVLQRQLEDAEAAKTTAAPPVTPPAAAPAPTAPAQPASGQPGTPAATPVYPPVPAAAPPAASSGMPTYGAPTPATGYPTTTEPTYGGATTATPAAVDVATPTTVADASLDASASPARPGRGLRVGGVVCGLGGVAFIGAGIVFGALTKSFSDSVQNDRVFNPSNDDRGKLYESLQWVGYGVGAGLFATGAVLYGIGRVVGGRASVAIAPTPVPGGAALTAGGTF